MNKEDMQLIKEWGQLGVKTLKDLIDDFGESDVAKTIAHTIEEQAKQINIEPDQILIDFTNDMILSYAGDKDIELSSIDILEGKDTVSFAYDNLNEDRAAAINAQLDMKKSTIENLKNFNDSLESETKINVKDFNELIANNASGFTGFKIKNDVYIHNAKKELEQTIDDISRLGKELERQRAKFEKNGGPEHAQTAKEISRISKEIQESTIKYAELKHKISPLGRTEKVLRDFQDKIKDGCNKMINAGKNTMSKITDALSRANDRFYVHGLSAYSQIKYDVNKIYRNYKAVEYSVNKSMRDVTDKMISGIEKAGDRANNIKEAFKNLGRAIAGKEMVLPDNSHKTQIPFLNDIRSEFNLNMKVAEHDFNQSLNGSKDELFAAKEATKSINILSESLDKRIENAKQESITRRAERGSAKETKEIDKDDSFEDRIR